MKTKNFYLLSRILLALSFFIFSFLPKVGMGAGCGGDFTFTQDQCNPYTITFNAPNIGGASYSWSFGDATSGSGLSVSHTYSSYQVFSVTLTYSGSCTDVITKNVPVVISPGNIIYNNDTTICKGASVSLTTNGVAGASCWTLGGATISTSTSLTVIPPVGTTTYVFNSRKTGAELISNGNFSNDNDGSFTSLYGYRSYVFGNGSQDETYSVGFNPAAWESGAFSMADHTTGTGTGKMMILNGSTVQNRPVWITSIPVKPNTNYIFSAWLANTGNVLYLPSLQFSIAGAQIGVPFTSSATLGIWQQFYIVWNSGSNNGNVTIQIVNQGTGSGGNDFAIDDISFIEAEVKTEPVTVTVLDPQAPLASQTLAPTCIAGGTITVSSPAPQTGIITYSIDGSTYTNTSGVFTGLNPGTYGVTYKDNTGNAGCVSPPKSVVISPRPPNPTVTLSPGIAICIGGSGAPLTAGGASTYSWSPSTGLSATTGATVTANPTTTQTYTVTGTDANGCFNTATVTVTVNPKPTVTVSANTAICIGGSGAPLTAGGASTYSWSPSTGLSATTGATVTANPTTTQTYTVTGTDANGCFNTATVTVTVNPKPTVTVSPNIAICEGSATGTPLTAGGASTYSWSPSTGLSATTGATVTANPTTTQTYTVTGTDANGCFNTATVTVTVNPKPTVTVSANTAICIGGSGAPLTAGGASTYSWSPSTGLSATTGATVTANPTTTQTYTVTGTDANGCFNTATVTVTVNPKPTVTVSANTAICIGGSGAPLTAGGASTYSWSPSTGLSATTGATVTANPTTTQTYTVTGTDANGCFNTATVTVTVNPKPTVTVSPNIAICEGSATGTPLTAGGASTYSWSPSTGLSATTGATVTANPTTTQTYTVTGTDANGCFNTATVTVTVNPKPTVTVSANTAICIGGSGAPLTAGGASTYSWSPSTGLSATTGATVTANPTTTQTYTVTGTDANGCFNTATVTVTVNPKPTVTVSANTAICIGGSGAPLTAGGASTYSWSPSTGLSATTGATVTANPTTTQTYTVTGTDANGCFNTATVTVTVNPKPTVTVSPNIAICEGSATGTPLTAGGASTYSWSPSTGLSATTGATVTANPTTTQTYTVTGTDANGCFNTATVTVTVNPKPTVTVSANTAICIGGSGAPLTAGGASTYSWSPSTGLSATTGATVTANPTTTQTYTVTGTDANGCFNTATVTVTVNPKPTVTVSANTAICIGGSGAPLTAGGASTYSWSPSTGLSATTGATVTANPTTTQTYTVTGTDANGCFNTATVTVTVNPKPTVTVSPNIAICEGSATGTPLTAGGASTYSWSPSTGLSATTGATVTANPTTTQTYTVTGTDANGCFNTATVTVTVNPKPTVTVSANTAICIGGSGAPLTAGGASTYSWSPSTGLSATTGATVTANPTTTQTYTVTGTDANGCFNTATVTVTVNPKPTVTVSANTAICIGGSGAPLTAGGASTYSWSPSTGLSATTGATVTANPTTTQTYTVTGTDANGCFNTATVTVTVNPKPTVTVSPNIAICEGSATGTPLTAGGASTYSWSPSTGLSATTGATVTANPTTTQTYTVTGTDANGCFNTATVTVTVNPKPTVTVSANTAICIGGSGAPLTAGGASTYSWSPSTGLSATTGATVTANPTTTQTYTVTGTDANGCFNTATVTVTVNPKPTVTVSANTAICIGGSGAPLTAGGASTYSWSPSTGLSATTGATVTANPTTTQTYTVTGTDANGCFNTATVTVTVNPKPTVTVSANTAICIGGSGAPLTAGGASTYSWSPSTGLSATTGATVTANPTTTQTYTVTGTDANGCFNTATVTVTVNPKPTVTVSANTAICIGGSGAPLTAGGASTYSWSPSTGLSATTGATVTANPTTTQTYTVTGTDANGCFNTATVTVTVNPKPTVTVSANTAICIGGLGAPLTAGGASTYSWSPSTGLSATTGATVTANPTTTQTYTVTGTDANGCFNTATVTVTVNPKPTVTVSPNIAICEGSATGTPLTAGGASTYSWSPSTGLSATTGATVTANPTTTQTYTVTGTDANGCFNTATVTVTVNPKPTPAFAAVSPICSGATLNALPTTSTNGITGTWSPALNNTATTIYTFTPAATECATTATLVITVNALPTVTVSSATVCAGTSATITATPNPSGIYNYVWTVPSGATDPGNVASFSATVGGNYFVVATNTATNCVSTSVSGSLTVNPKTTPAFAAVSPICSGATLNALPTTSTNGITGTWSPALNNTATTIYTFTPAATECATTATLTITVNPKTTPAFAAVSPICSGATLSALPTTSTNGITGTWLPALNNTATTTYTFTPAATECATTATLVITVNPKTTPAFAAVSPICSGATLSALPTTSTNGITGTWLPALNNTATTTYTFTPAATECATTATLVITVNPKTTPAFAAVAPICSGATLSALPTTSTNGITGTWLPALDNTATTTYTFTPAATECATTATLVITVNLLPSAPTVTLTQPSCSTATGSINITAPTGNGETYNLDGGAYQGGTSFSSVVAGSHSITAKSSGGCISPATSITIDAQPATPPAPTASVTQPTCTTATGTITITNPTGVGIEYSINGTTYQSGVTFNNVNAGNYSLTVKNAAGCISSPTVVTVNTQPSTPPAPAATVTQPTCTVLTGGITVTTPSPSAGITYSIDGTTYINTTGIFTALAPNTYSVTVKNSDGCISVPASITVDAPPATPAAPTVSVVQPLSCSASTGTITVSAPAPASGISYSIDGTTYSNTTGIFTTVGPGTYSVTTKNGAGCISSPTSAIVDPPPSAPPAPTASVTQQPTCTVPTGIITVNTPIPAAGLTYSIDGTTYTNTTGIFNNVVPGTYNITVKNAAGCISAAASVTVDAPPSAPTAPTTGVTQPTCAAATGTITVTTPAPASGITYSIDGTTYTNTTGIFNSLTPGTYSLTTKNAAGCISAPTSVTVIGQPATPPAPVVTLIQPTCSTSTGTITVTTPAPGSGITYSIDGTTYTNTSGIFSSLAAATYSVTAKNSTGCISAPTSVAIDAAPSAPAAPVAGVAQPTCTVPTGMITVTTPAPGSGITYSIDGTTYTNTTGIFIGLTPNSYSLTVKNAAGCISSPTVVTVNTQPATPPAPAATVTQPTCTVLTGGITVTTPSPSAGITYSIDGTTYINTTGIFTALAPNTYSVTVKNSDGCISVPASITVDAPPATPAAPTVSVVQPLSCSASTGTITVSAPAPASGISYSIDGTTYSNTTGIFTTVGPGTYSVTTKNGAGCISSPTSAIVDPPPSAPPAPTASVTQQPTCTVPTGIITVNTPIPAAGLTYSIDGTTYTNTTGIFNNVVPGTYNITVKNAAGCISAAASVTVDAPPSAPTAPTTGVTQPTCAAATGTITITSSTTGFEYALDGSTFAAYPTGGFSGVAAGKHTIAIRNAAGCSTTIDVTVNAQPLPPAAATTAVTDPTCSTPTGAIMVTSSTTGLEFSLDGGTYGAYPAAGYSGLSTGAHTIGVRNTDGCITTASVTIKGAPGAPASPTVSVTDPTCTVATGSIAITSSTTGFTYSLDGGTFAAYPTGGYSGLSTGKHTITTKNVDGCTTTIDVDIKGAPGAPTAPTTGVTQPTCAAATGTITITSSTTGFEYALDGSTFAAYPTGGFSGVAAGKHTIAIRNAAGCSTTIDVTVNAQPLPPAAPTTTVTDPTCSTPTGAIAITSTTTGLEFSLDGGAYGTYPAAGYSGLSTGAHTIGVRNTDGCITTASVTIKGAPGAPASPTVSVTDPTCTVATGSIAITSSTTGFTYSLDGGTFATYPTGGYSGLSTGKHTITTKNVDGCTTTIDVDIKGAPGAPTTPKTGVTQPTCAAATGTITITSSTTGFEYALDGGTFAAYPTGGFSGVAAGKHTIAIRNAAGCSTTIDVTVNAQPLPPAAPTTTVTDPTCSTPTGAIAITSTTTGLEFSLDGGAYGTYPAAGYSGLSTGAHTIGVRNTDGCITTASVTIKGAPGAPASPTVSVTDPTCTVATGSIAITSSTTGFTYSLDGGTFATYPTGGYSGLSTGKHTITTKNVDGCTTTIDVDIKGAPGAPTTPKTGVTQPTCAAATGTITITSSTTGFEYALDGGTFAAYPTGGFSGVAAGKHTIAIRNAAGCSTTIDVTVNAQPLPPAAPTTTVTDPTCSTPTGAIAITSTTTGLEFSLDGGAYGTYPAAGYSGLSTGAHTIGVRNTDGCITTASVTIKGAPGAPASPTVSVTDPTCTVATGSIAITSSTTGFTYSLDGGTFATYPTGGYSGLSTGKHTITTKNVDGCTTPLDVDVKGAPGLPPAPTFSITQPTCATPTGTIAITSSTSGFEYSVDNSAFAIYPTTGYTGISAGKHTITIRNTSGCTTIVDANVNAQPLPPAAPTTVVTDPTCSTPTGTITITSTTTNLEFSLDGGAYAVYPATGYTGLSASKHTVAVKNIDGCITSTSVDIPPAAGAPVAPIINVTQPTCTVGTGVIIVTAQTGVGFTYTIDGTTYQAGSTFTNVAPGMYPVQLKNALGCISPVTTAVIDKPTVVTRVTRNVSVCSGQSFTMPAGQVVSITGIYTDTLKYVAGCDSLISTINLLVGVTLVQNQAVTLCSGQTYTLVTGQVVSASGLYRDTLKSAAGCDSAIINTTVTAKTLVVKNVTSVLCVGQTYTLPSGKILNSSGIYKDTLKYTGGCDSLITNVDLTIKTIGRDSKNVTVCAGEVYVMPGGQVVSTTGIYIDTLKYNPSGCDSLITTVNLIKLPTIFQSKSVNLCPGQTFTLPNGSVASVSGIYADTIRSVRGCDSLITQTRVTIPIIRTTNLPASVCEGKNYVLPWGPTVVSQGVYSDTLRSLSGCDSLIRKVTLTINANPVITLSKTNDVDCSVQSATLTATGASRYLWSSTERIDNVNIPNPVIRPRATATYRVTATGANGCVSQDSIKVTFSLTGGFNALVPSAFTPNNDGLNDCFGVSTWGFVEGLQFMVYNRWGNVVFQTTDPSRCWDGTYKGVTQDAGTYIYQASGKTLCGQVYQKGTVVLIR